MKTSNRVMTATMAVIVVTGSLSFFNEYAVAQVGAGQPAASPQGRGHATPLLGIRRLASALQLSDAQRQSIRQVLKDARSVASADASAARADRQALLIPTDPNHATAVAAAKQRAANRVEQRADIEARIYALLTPEQQARLPQLLAARPARS